MVLQIWCVVLVFECQVSEIVWQVKILCASWKKCKKKVKVTWCMATYGVPYLEFVFCISTIQVHTHNSEYWTHTMNTHLEQSFLLWRLGVQCIAQGHLSCGYWRWKRALNPTTFRLQISLTIRLQLPQGAFGLGQPSSHHGYAISLRMHPLNDAATELEQSFYLILVLKGSEHRYNGSCDILILAFQFVLPTLSQLSHSVNSVS